VPDGVIPLGFALQRLRLDGLRKETADRVVVQLLSLCPNVHTLDVLCVDMTVSALRAPCDRGPEAEATAASDGKSATHGFARDCRGVAVRTMP
jgi:hypothetical protein